MLFTLKVNRVKELNHIKLTKNKLFRFLLYCNCYLFLAFFTVSSTYGEQAKKEVEATIFIDFEKIEQEKNIVRYELGELMLLMEEEVSTNKEISIPENATEFERVFCTARRIQHNDSQLVAIKILKTLLEFEYYRSPGEELLLKFLMGNSLRYVGAPLIAYSYMEPIFPEVLHEAQGQNYSILLNSYAALLISIDSIEKAKNAYLLNLKLFSKENNQVEMYNARNNIGFSYQLLNMWDSAKFYYKENQKKVYKDLTPVLYAFSFGNYGSVMLKENKLDSALHYFFKEIDLLKAIGSEAGIFNTYAGIAEVYMLTNKLDSAKQYYKLALQKSKEHEQIEPSVKNYNDLLNLYAKEKEDQELIELLNNFFLLNDSLKGLVSSRAVKDELQVSRFLNILKETEENKRRTDLLENRNKELIYTIVALAFIVILLAITITFRHKSRRQLKGKNLELKEKNLELERSYALISDSNKKNEILLKELHHRVKNNLQIISSLFNLQLNASELDFEAQQVFQNAKNRIYSISLVHKKIYQSDNVSTLDFEEYIRDFSDELLKATPNDVNISIEIQRNPISIESAIPLGLIFNELFTNSLKHAKRHDSLKISIKHEDLPNSEKFIYTDNGVGVKNIEVMKESDNSIGVTLIHLLGEQLNAKIEYKEAFNEEHGFWLSIEGNF